MKRIGLILLILVGMIILTGCSIIFTAPDCCTPPITPPPAQTCSLTFTAGYGVWGTIYYQTSTGQIVNTGQYIDYDDYWGIYQPTATVYNMPCGQEIWVYLVDACNDVSHVEVIILKPGQNFLYFSYWKNKDKAIDFHQR